MSAAAAAAAAVPSPIVEDEEDEDEFYSDEDEDVSPLLDAIYEGDLTGVQKALVDYGTDDINTPDADGYPPLHLAAHYGYADILSKLLKNGAKADLVSSDGCTALLLGAQNGYIPVVKTLLDHPDVQADPDEKSLYTPLFVAAQSGHKEICQLLVKGVTLQKKKPADVNRKVNGVSPVLVACQEGHHDVVHFLIDSGADVTAATEHGATPLFVACKKGHAAIVNTILEYSVKDINHSAHDGVTPLLVAIEIGNIQEVETLIDYGADIEQADKEGHTPLLMAAIFGDVDILEVLLECGADQSKRDSSGRTAAEILDQEFGEDLAAINNNLKDDFPGGDDTPSTPRKSRKKKKRSRGRKKTSERADVSSDRLKKKAKKIFKKYDADSNGVLDRAELYSCLDGLGCKKHLSDGDFAVLVDSKLKKFDKDDNSALDIGEFFKLFRKLIKHQKKIKRDNKKEELDLNSTVVQTEFKTKGRSKGKSKKDRKKKSKKKKPKKKSKGGPPPARDQSIWGLELVIRPGDIDIIEKENAEKKAAAEAAAKAEAEAAAAAAKAKAPQPKVTTPRQKKGGVDMQESFVLASARQELKDGHSSRELYRFGSAQSTASASSVSSAAGSPSKIRHQASKRLEALPTL